MSALWPCLTKPKSVVVQSESVEAHAPLSSVSDRAFKYRNKYNTLLEYESKCTKNLLSGIIVKS